MKVIGGLLLDDWRVTQKLGIYLLVGRGCNYEMEKGNLWTII